MDMKLLSLLHGLIRGCGGKDDAEKSVSVNGDSYTRATKKSPPPSADSQESSSSKITSKPNCSDANVDTVEDVDFWWKATSAALQTMTSKAGYSREDEVKILDFSRKYVVGNLGPRPTADGRSGHWRSFMTDDFTPMEFSWNWGLTSDIKQPTIRFSIEAIDRNSGHEKDPWNMSPTVRLMRRLQNDIPGCDCSTFNALAPRLAAMCKEAPVHDTGNPDLASPSSMFMAFDLDGGKPTVKAYMLPFIHFATSEKSRGQVVCDFLMPYAQEQGWESLVELLEFGVTSKSRLGIEPFMIAFDCVPDAKNRMKIYFRSSDTSFASVVSALSAHNDRLSQGGALDDLRALWHGIFGVDPSIDPSAPLRHKDHETAGILYYYEVRPRSSQVTAKVYLPAKHYGIDDAVTTRAIADFFRTRQQQQLQLGRESSDEPCWGDRYASMVEAVCGHRALGAGRGLHSYVTCSLKGGALDCTSYLNPEIYHLGRKK